MAEKKKRRPSLSLRAQRKVRKMATAPDLDEEGYVEKERFASDKSKHSGRFGILKFLIPVMLIVTLLISYFIIVANHPVGIVEYFGSKFASGGSGSGYDLSIFGGKPKYTLSDSGKYYVVTETSVNCYNEGGKVIFERSHAYTEPIIKVAETRYLLYGQGETVITVSSLTDNLYVNNLEKSIITAAISDSGCYAVAAKADGYDSAVYVYNKSNKKIYEWYSSGETVNALALSKDGKTLAVATVSVKDGNFSSNIYFFNFDSADAIMKSSYGDDIVYGLYESGAGRFCAVFSRDIEFIDYKKNTVKTNESDYSVTVVKNINNKFIVLRNVAANQDQSIIEIYKDNGELVSSFSVNNYITDFSFRSDNLYLLGISKVYKYDMLGSLCAEADVNYDALYVEAVSSDSIACVRNSVIEKINLTKTGD